NRIAGGQLFAAEQLKYKAYLRHPGDMRIVVDELRRALQPAEPVVYLNADVCRADLLVEIEAVGIGGPPQPHWAMRRTASTLPAFVDSVMLTPVRRLIETVVMLTSLTLLGLICLSWTVFALPLLFLLPERAGTRCGRRGILVGFRLYVWSL